MAFLGVKESKEWFGLVAGALTTISFLPQVFDIFFAEDKYLATAGISIWMYLVFVTGVFIWMVYGIAIKSTSVILWNFATFIFAGSVFSMLVYYKWIVPV